MKALPRLGAGALTAALLVAAAPAFAADLARENCFEGAQVADWVVAGDNAIFLRTTTQDIYRIDLAGKVPLRAPASQVVVTSNMKTVCSGADLKVYQSRYGPLGVSGITKLTDQEIADAGVQALPGRRYRGH